MLRTFASKTLLKRPCVSKDGTQVRFLWEFVNMMFNKPDPKRIELVGPDRACAEWVLRNGGAVKWSNGEVLNDYNSLPAEGVRWTLAEIDGSNSSISHYGFPHLTGCQHLKKIILHNDKYIENRALKGLVHGKDTLQYVQVSRCASVTDSGVKEMQELKKLQTLILFDLQSVSDLKDCANHLKSKLPNCKIEINP